MPDHQPPSPAEPAVTAAQALDALWSLAQMPREALASVTVPAQGPILPSSFNVSVAAQAALAAAALAAAEFWHLRQPSGARQTVRVDASHAVIESLAYFSLDAKVPEIWEKFSGLYPCGPADARGWVRIHANFAHHRDGALRLLGCPTDGSAEREDVARALANWRAEDFERAAAQAGLVVAAARDFSQWDPHPQALALAASPVLSIMPIDGAPPCAPRPPVRLGDGERPLHGIRVLDLTRILAGPVAGRTLAAYGADVMLVNSPSLPNIAAIADTSRGKRSVLLDLKHADDARVLRTLAGEADVFLQGYRPGAMDSLGFSAPELAALRPGIVHASISAYGHTGPWADRRGFDSLVQTATGFNLAEAAAFGQAEPRALPLQVLDYCAGYLLAYAIQVALRRRALEGGSWQVRVSLAGVGHWLRSLGRVQQGSGAQRPSLEPYLDASDSGWGRLLAVRHAAQFSRTPARWDRPSVRPGTDRADWRD